MALDLSPFRNLTIYLFLLMMFQVGWVIKGIPFINRILVKIFNKISGICLPLEAYWESLFGWEMLETVWCNIQIDMNKKIVLKEKAPDAPVITMDGDSSRRGEEKLTSLLDHASQDRPLVMNFGSYNCPVFTAKLNHFFSIEKEFRDVADFAIVYIEEAHPTDGWAFKSDIKIPAHKSIQDRLSAAKRLQDDFQPPCPVLVDSMLDAASMSYGATPIRLHVITNGILEYEGGIGPFMYNMNDLRDWLARFKTIKT